MSDEDGSKVMMTFGFLKTMWTVFFFILESTYKIILLFAVVFAVHWALGVIARRWIYLKGLAGELSSTDRRILYRMANWWVPPIVGPSLIVIPMGISKILFKIRTLV